MSAAAKKRCTSEAMAKAAKGRTGHHHSAETKAKISASNKLFALKRKQSKEQQEITFQQ